MLRALKKLLQVPDGSPLPIVEVAWMDAAGDPSVGGAPADLGGLEGQITVGYLTRVEREFVVLCTDHWVTAGPSVHVRGPQSIPTGWIVFARAPGFPLLEGPRFKRYNHLFPRRSGEALPAEGAPAPEGPRQGSPAPPGR